MLPVLLLMLVINNWFILTSEILDGKKSLSGYKSHKVCLFGPEEGVLKGSL